MIGVAVSMIAFLIRPCSGIERSSFSSVILTVGDLRSAYAPGATFGTGSEGIPAIVVSVVAFVVPAMFLPMVMPGKPALRH
jgi:hypothetical protein